MIVVLVILAILAAMLVPALLGWINEARKKQYQIEARNIYMGAQAVADEAYSTFALGESGTIADLQDYLNTDAAKKRIHELADVDTDDLAFSGLKSPANYSGDAERTAYVIGDMQVVFWSQNGKQVGATLQNGKWNIKEGTTAPQYETEAKKD